MSGTVSTRWYFTDWMSDEGVRACSLAARGLWIDLLCIAGSNRDKEHGFVLIAGKVPTPDQLARRLGSTADEVDGLLKELAENRVFSRDRRGVIYSRRMVRAEKNRGNGRLGGNPNLMENKEKQKSVEAKAKPLIPVPEPEPAFPSEKTLFDVNSDWPVDYREQFWRTYPRRTEKKAAMAKLTAIKRSGKIPWANFWAGVLHFVEAMRGRDEQYVKHPTTWLNKGCWDDEHQTNGGKNVQADRTGGEQGFATFAIKRAREARGESAE